MLNGVHRHIDLELVIAEAKRYPGQVTSVAGVKHGSLKRRFCINATLDKIEEYVEHTSSGGP